MPARPLRLALALLALALGTAAARADEASPEAAIRALAAPGEATRREAVEALVHALPASRAPVIAALAEARPEVQVHLIEVLGRDGSPAAIRALLETLTRADDLQAGRIRYALVRHPEASRRVLEAWAEDPRLRAPDGEEPPPAVLALESMLRRAEAERLFLARKSATGGTGSYRGQYESLRPYREEAVAMCVGILLDRAIDEPGVFTTGRYEFLRPTDRSVDMDELTGMASHAFAEMAQPTDHRAILELTNVLTPLRRRINAMFLEDDVAFLEELSRYTDILVALYRVDPSRFESQIDGLLEQISFGGRWWRVLTGAHRAAILLRVGRYEEAIEEFEDLVSRPDPIGLTSRTMTYYNLACAYAQWGEKLEGAAREQMRMRALAYLERTVDAGWSDVGWMDEDRDLDPIRDTPLFRRLRARVNAANVPPEDR